jgi:hypothetical protein
MNYARRLARRLSTRRSSGAAPKKLRRRLFSERLEERSLLAGNVAGFLSDYYNQGRPTDVNADGEVAPLDALLIINQLNAGRAGMLPQGAAGAAGEGSPGRLFVDVNNDGEAAPLDALLVINALLAEGEDPLQPTDVARYEVRILAAGTNTPISTVSIGQQFDLQLRVQDVRPAESPASANIRGVFTAYTELLINELSSTDNDAILDLFTVGVPEIQTITINATPASGTFTLTFGGQTTAPIILADQDGIPLTTAEIRTDISAKLAALPNIGAGNVLVVANSASIFTVRFIGNKYNIDQPLMTTNAGANITVTELNPSDPQAFIEAFRSVPIPGVGGTGSNYQTFLDAELGADRIGDLGATDLRADPSQGTPGTGVQEVARVRLIAGTQAGSITFIPDFAEANLERSLHDTTLYSSPGVNPVGNGTVLDLAGRVTAVASASQFTAAGLVGYPAQPAVGDIIAFAEGPAQGPDPFNPAERTITAYNPATGEITVDQPFPAAPRLTGQGGANHNDGFNIALNNPQFVDLVGANPVSATVTIVTGPVDAKNDTATVNEDTPLVLNVITNTTPNGADETQPPGGTILITAIGTGANGPQRGTVTFTPTGNVTYTPTTNLNGPDSFTYTVKNNSVDPAGANPDTATVTVNVTAVNDNPTITAPGPQTVGENGGTRTVTVTGIGPGGGTDEAGQSVTVSILTNSNPGAVTASIDSSNVITLTGVTAGSSNITLQAVDTGSPAGTTTVTFGVTVGAVNDPPVVTGPATATTDVDVPLTFSAANGNKFSVTDPDAGSGVIQVVITSSNGTIQGGAGNTRTITGTLLTVQSALDTGVTYVPPAGFDGPATLTVVANDNGNTGDGGPQSSNTLTVNITVQPAVPKPIADNDTFNGAVEDTQFIAPAPGVLDGDTDPLGRLPLTAVGAVMQANFGTVVLNPDGSFTYNPAPDFSGPASFTYRAQASDLTQSNPATVTINVGGTNDPPTAVADGSDANPIPIIKLDVDPVAFAKQPIAVLANDTDVDSPVSQLVVGTIGVSANGATIEKSPDGKLILYTPALGFEGKDSFTYTASDGTAESAPALVTVNVVNAVPKDVSGRVLLDGGTLGLLPLSGITVQLTGKDFNGADVNLQATTNANGDFTFAGVTPPQTSYKLTQLENTLFLDGPEVNSTSSPLATITGNDEFTLTWSLTNQDPLTGLHFIEQGINLTGLGDVTKAEQTAKAGPDGFWLLADLAGNTIWSFTLPGGGWTGTTSYDIDFNLSNLAHATLNIGGVATSTGLQSIVIHQNPAHNTEGNYPPGATNSTPLDIGPRFRVYGTNGFRLFRIDGTAAEFGLAPQNGTVAANGAEGEGMSNRNFAEAADEVFGANGWA